MRWIDGDGTTGAYTSNINDNPNNAFPWIAIDLGNSTTCKIYKITLQGGIPRNAGNLNVS